MLPFVLTGPQKLTNKIVQKTHASISNKKAICINAYGSNMMPDMFFKTRLLVSYDIISFLNFKEEHITEQKFMPFTEKLFIIATGCDHMKIKTEFTKITIPDFSTLPEDEIKYMVNHFAEIMMAKIELMYLPLTFNPYDAKILKPHYHKIIEDNKRFIDVTMEAYSYGNTPKTKTA